MTPEALARLHAAAFTTPAPWSAEAFAGMLTLPGILLLHESDGFLLARIIAGEAELLTLAADPARRRQGIACRLLNGFLTEAERQQAEAAFLEVAADNTAARALYAAAGFRQQGLRRGYYRNPGAPAVDALILTLPLPRLPALPDR